jgi:hypothetical protein
LRKRNTPLRLLKPHETGIALVLVGLLAGSCATVEAPLGPIGDAKGDGAVLATQGGERTDIECAILGETMTMRVGVEGRLLVGPKGGPGSVKVPLRMALVAEGPKPQPIWSKFYNVDVTVPPGASQAVFSVVEDDLTFPLPAGRRIDNYIVYVGFDPQGAAAAARPPAAKPKPAAKPAPKTSAAPAAKSPAPAAPAPAKQQPQFEPPPSPPPGVFAPPPGH